MTLLKCVQADVSLPTPPRPSPPPPFHQACDGYQLQDLRCGKCGSVAASHLQHHCDVCGGHLKATQAAVSTQLLLRGG